jgi:hypothetical protein
MGILKNLNSRTKAGYVLAIIGVGCALFSFISLVSKVDLLNYLFYIAVFFISCLIFLVGIYFIFTKMPDEKTLELFNQLKLIKNCNSDDEPLIEPTRCLIICNLMPGFYCLPVINRIFYNEKSLKISDNAISFSFLHEEGHFREIQSNVVIGLFGQIVLTGTLVTGFLSGICLLIFGSLLLGGNFEKPEILITLITSLILFVIFLLLATLFILIGLMTTRTFQTPLQMDEYASDEYASKALRVGLGVDKPSLYLREVLEDITKDFETIYGKKRGFYRKMQYVFKGGTHPSIEDRVERIQKYIDKKTAQ